MTVRPVETLMKKSGLQGNVFTARGWADRDGLAPHEPEPLAGVVEPVPVRALRATLSR